MAFLKRVRRSLLPRLLLATVVLAAPGRVAGAQPAVSESDVKAAFLYNFTKFVEWPSASFPDARSPLKICVLGEDPFGKTLRALADGEVVGRPLSLLRLDNLSNPAACHVLFISRSEKKRLPQILAVLDNAPVLTVGDTPEFFEQGGIINFILEESKVRFEINQEAAERVGIKISSKLLALARHVKGRP
jgi:YfiR/HmsC-like